MCDEEGSREEEDPIELKRGQFPIPVDDLIEYTIETEEIHLFSESDVIEEITVEDLNPASPVPKPSYTKSISTQTEDDDRDLIQVKKDYYREQIMRERQKESREQEEHRLKVEHMKLNIERAKLEMLELRKLYNKL